MLILNDDDFVFPAVRGHGLPHLISKGVDPKYYLAEHCGKSTGSCGGVSTYHNIDTEHGFFGLAGTLGTGFPISVGYGMTSKWNGKQQVVVSCFGDGTSNRGTLHESFLMAANWKLPIVWVCENNQLSMYVPVKDHHPVENIADLAFGYGMPGEVVDGQDVVAVAKAVDKAVARARAGEGPSLIECKTERFVTHSIGLPDRIDLEDRTKDDYVELKKRDPVVLFQEKLLKEGVLTQKEMERIDQEIAVEIDAAEAFADAGSPPDPSVLDDYLYAK